MKQYCRYCVYLTCGDSCYCYIKEKSLSYESCKRANKCKHFELNPIDAFGENPNEYKPRATFPRKKQICFDLKGGAE